MSRKMALPESSSKSLLVQLPDELLAHVFSFLEDPSDHQNAAYSCRRLLHVSRQFRHVLMSRNLLVWWNRFPDASPKVITKALAKITDPTNGELSALNDVGALLVSASSAGLADSVSALLAAHSAHLAHPELMVAAAAAKLCNHNALAEVLQQAAQKKAGEFYAKFGDVHTADLPSERALLADSVQRKHVRAGVGGMIYLAGAYPLLRSRRLNNESVMRLPFLAGEPLSPGWDVCSILNQVDPRTWFITMAANQVPYDTVCRLLEIIPLRRIFHRFRQRLTSPTQGMVFCSVTNIATPLGYFLSHQAGAGVEHWSPFSQLNGNPINESCLQDLLVTEPRRCSPSDQQARCKVEELLLAPDMKAHLHTRLLQVVASVAPGSNNGARALYWCALLGLKTQQPFVVDSALSSLLGYGAAATNAFSLPVGAGDGDGQKMPPMWWFASLLLVAAERNDVKVFNLLLQHTESHVWASTDEHVHEAKQCWSVASPIAICRGAADVLGVCLANTGVSSVFLVGGIMYTLPHIALLGTGTTPRCVRVLLEHPALAELTLTSLEKGWSDPTWTTLQCYWSCPFYGSHSPGKVALLLHLQQEYNAKRTKLNELVVGRTRRLGDMYTPGKVASALLELYTPETVNLAAMVHQDHQLAARVLLPTTAGHQIQPLAFLWALPIVSLQANEKTTPLAGTYRINDTPVPRLLANAVALLGGYRSSARAGGRVARFETHVLTHIPSDTLLLILKGERHIPIPPLKDLVWLFSPTRLVRCSPDPPNSVAHVLAYPDQHLKGDDVCGWKMLQGHAQEIFNLLGSSGRQQGLGLFVDIGADARHLSPRQLHAATSVLNVLFLGDDGQATVSAVLAGGGGGRVAAAIALACNMGWNRLIGHVIAAMPHAINTAMVEGICARALAQQERFAASQTDCTFLAALLSCPPHGHVLPRWGLPQALRSFFVSHAPTLRGYQLNGNAMLLCAVKTNDTAYARLLLHTCHFPPTGTDQAGGVFTEAVAAAHHHEADNLGLLSALLESTALPRNFTADTLQAVCMAAGEGNQAAYGLLRDGIHWPGKDEVDWAVVNQVAVGLVQAGNVRAMRALSCLYPNMPAAHVKELLKGAAIKGDAPMVRHLITHPATKDAARPTPEDVRDWGGPCNNRVVSQLLCEARDGVHLDLAPAEDCALAPHRS